MESRDLGYSRHSGAMRKHRTMVRNCAPENLEIPGSLASLPPRNDWKNLTSGGRGLIAAPMTIASTMFIARRRRIIAVWADVCV